MEDIKKEKVNDEELINNVYAFITKMFDELGEDAFKYFYYLRYGINLILDEVGIEFVDSNIKDEGENLN